MAFLGRHLSISGSIANSVSAAEELGCTAMQIFTRNPRGWATNPVSDSDAKAFRDALSTSSIKKTISHLPYLPNFATPKESLYELSKRSLDDEAERCGKLGIDYIVMHLGSHMGKGREFGVDRVSSAVSEAAKMLKGPMILLENQSAQLNSIGSTTEELAEIRDRIGSKRVGFCLDTCHAFAAGYDIRKEEVVDTIFKSLGKENVPVVHLNDAKFPINSHRDRHENIGFGEIGRKGFDALLHSTDISGKTLILETPVGSNISPKEEISLVRKLME